MEYVIDIHNLTYHYNNEFKALDDITIQVPQGSIYGFLGPNGAGKSTTMRMLAGMMYDESNKVHLFGQAINHQMPQVFRRVGCLVDHPVLYQHLTAKDHLQLVMKSNDIAYDRLDEILEIVDLMHAKDLAVKRYSLGMKQRLAIALCLVKEPELLILDEPVNGLDPNGMQEIRQLLVRLNKEWGITIFISSHLLSELEKMCTHVCIIHKGQIQFAGDMTALRQQFDGAPVKITTGERQHEPMLSTHSFIPHSDHIIVHIQDKEDIPRIIKELVQQGIAIYNVQQEGNLESWFLDLIQ